jgi:signal transduction histidine kinase
MTPAEGPGGTSAAAVAKLRHDLANPLAAVLAETQLLLLSPELLNAETLSGLKQIETLARRMRQILQDLEP